MNKTVIQHIASAVQARLNCKASGNQEWYEKHTDRAEDLVEVYMPSGSGFDMGTKIDWQKSNADKIVFDTSFHHMNGNGYYDGWTEHQVVVTPSFQGLNLRVTGRDRNDIKDYIIAIFDTACEREVEL